jgi:hypothetical protein
MFAPACRAVPGSYVSASQVAAMPFRRGIPYSIDGYAKAKPVVLKASQNIDRPRLYIGAGRHPIIGRIRHGPTKEPGTEFLVVQAFHLPGKCRRQACVTSSKRATDRQATPYSKETS